MKSASATSRMRVRVAAGSRGRMVVSRRAGMADDASNFVAALIDSDFTRRLVLVRIQTTVSILRSNEQSVKPTRTRGGTGATRKRCDGIQLHNPRDYNEI